MFNSLKRVLPRVLGYAAHAPRQRAMSAGVAAPAKASTVSKEEEAVKSWTCYDVIEWASSIIAPDVLSVDSLKAAKLDGKSLLEMRQNQSLKDALMSNGLEPTVVYQLAGGVRELLPEGVSMGCVLLRHPSSLSPSFPRCPLLGIADSCIHPARFVPPCITSPLTTRSACPSRHLPRCAESKSRTVFISSEEDDEDPTPITFESQSQLDGYLSRQWAGSLQLTGGTGTNHPFVLALEKLADGDTYSLASEEHSGFAKVKKGLNIVQGRLRTDDAILENDVSALSPHAELGCGAPCSRPSPSL